MGETRLTWHTTQPRIEHWRHPTKYNWNLNHKNKQDFSISSRTGQILLKQTEDFYFSLVCAIQPTYENKTYHFLFVLHTLQNLWFVVDRELDELLRHWHSGFFVPRCHMFSCPRSFIIVIGHHVSFSIFICRDKTELNDSSILLKIIFRL